MYDAEKNNRINKIIEAKTKSALDALHQQQVSLKIHQGANTPVKKQFSKTDGVINRIRFRFGKPMVFVHKGVGRGTKADQVGSTNRKAKEWLNPVIEKYADEMVAEVADEWVDIIFTKLKIK